MEEILSLLKRGTIGKPLWMRGGEAHFGPHSAWFYDRACSGGGALLDMGCHLIGIFNQAASENAIPTSSGEIAFPDQPPEKRSLHLL